MITLIKKWSRRVVHFTHRPVFFLFAGIFASLLSIGMPNGRVLGQQDLILTAPIESKKPNLTSVTNFQPVIQIQPIAKSKIIPILLLNRAKPTSTFPDFERPLPEEMTIPSLNIASLPLPDLTSGLLIVPSLELEEPITRVLVKNGRWDISELNAQVGHLQTTGERPGEGLAMTFVGHTTFSGTGPFAYLNQLAHGDQVIYRWNGYDYVYQIDQMAHVQPTQVGSLYEENGDAIVLATCSGWNSEAHQYDTRLVTRAVLIEMRPAPAPSRISMVS